MSLSQAARVMVSRPASSWRRLLDSPVAPLSLLATFAVLIVFTIGRFSIWFDESTTLELVGPRSYAEILKYTKIDVHPPLWYFVLKPWLQVFGANLIAARAQSAVFMIAAVGVWYHLLETRFSRSVALLALCLMVTNPTLLHYAVDGRMYAFGVLLTATSCLLLTGRWRWRWYAYWPCAVAMLYVHYFLSLVVAAQFLYLLLLRREQGRSLRWVVGYGASIVVAFLPWLPNALHHTSTVVTEGFWVRRVVPGTVLDYVLRTFLYRLDSDLSNAEVFPGLLYLVIWGAVLLRLGRAEVRRHALLWCLAALPPLVLFILSCKPLVPVFNPRYVVFGLPALIALLAIGALMFTNRWRVFIICGLVLGHLAGLQMLRWRGFSDDRGYWAMKEIAAEISEPIAGERPEVVATWIFMFFDARATLDDEQRVVHLREAPPADTILPDALYADRPDWYILSLSEVHARHVWLLERNGAAPLTVPASWHLVSSHVHGYAQTRLFEVGPP